MVIALAWILSVSPPDSSRTTPTNASVNASVRVWTDRDTPYSHGDPVHVFFRLDRPGYVTALRVDTDGQVRVLFPRNPWGDNQVRANQTLAITDRHDDYAFTIDDDAGVGYLFVIMSPFRFDYADLARGDYWDYRLINGGRIRGDPYVALTDLAERIAPSGAYDYDITSYYVERHYDYPRFVCAQCHSHPRDRGWDEYRRECTRFQLVIYDDPVYYPYRSTHGRNVVVDRPLHPGPRFIFRDAMPGTDYITRRRGRPDEADQRRARELSPIRPLIERHRVEERRGAPPREEPRRTRPARRPHHEPPSTGRPELRRRRKPERPADRGPRRES